MPHVQHSTLNEEQSARKPGQARLDRRLLSRRALAREMVPSVVDPAGPRTEDTKQQQQADGGAQYTDVTNGHQRVDSLSELIERLPIASRFLLPTFPSDTPPDPTIDTASLGREHTDTPNMHQLETVARATARQEQDSEEMRVQHRSRARARLPRMNETRAFVAYHEGLKAEETEPRQADGGNYAAVSYWVGDELLDGPTGTDHVSADLDNDDALTELSMSDIKSMNSMYSSKTRVMMSFTGPG
ncbi:hypothetical protein FA95DRAFT_1561594 [Auriscalpium vulgare]|uniref:Uncharacterized protein n=1 Tax=Auriscalpium vulgare TaxID=40419 RepID=A0ACB8RM41_9AGAM|nr:hypothetical protein FA95DRAFT_1561594 [Auriscalpium vulgare]